MEGKHIVKVVEGSVDGEDALILIMSDSSIYLIQSRSYSGMGGLSHEEVYDVPKDFELKEI